MVSPSTWSDNLHGDLQLFRLPAPNQRASTVRFVPSALVYTSGAEALVKSAALGFRVHSGWAAAVVLSVEKRAPIVLVRQRVLLVETFTYEFRQPYHTAEKMPFEKAGKFVARVRAEARQLACQAIHGLHSDLEKQGYQLTRCGLLLASGRPLPELSKILASHALIHTADGELFREAIVHGCDRCGLKMESIKEKELLERARKALHVKPAELMRRVTDLGNPLGAPWSQDEKFAALAAWLALLDGRNPRVTH